jgi:hypothetical protein
MESSMASRSTSAKRTAPARKRRAGPARAGAPSDPPPRRSAPAATSRIGDIAALLIDARRKDLDVLAQAGVKSRKGLQAVVRRHIDILKKALREWQSVIKVMRIAGPLESVARIDDLGRGALQMTIVSLRELAALTARTQVEAFDAIKHRIDEDLDEIERLLGRH